MFCQVVGLQAQWALLSVAGGLDGLEKAFPALCILLG
jgi:hypothetical protein